MRLNENVKISLSVTRVAQRLDISFHSTVYDLQVTLNECHIE